MGQHPFEEDKSMATTKIVAHQYVSIRALEAVLLQLTLRFIPAVWYRVSHINLRNPANNEHASIRGKLLRFSTVSDTDGKAEVGFHCTINMSRTPFGRLWDPTSFELTLEGETYEGSFASSVTYNILVDLMRKQKQ